ncbi:MAG: hypothetical protein K8T26_05300 [Lentisphaerae bacterium]|nr:hypothetical protein [Lentisphaerota bacterium]
MKANVSVGVVWGVGVVCALLTGACGRPEPVAEAVAPPVVAAPASAPVDSARLVGIWQRPDGGYVLEIRAVAPGGTLDCGYFNPNPIRVSQATWAKNAEQGLEVFVELRDVNYPGATYKLTYRPAEDALAGLYHQPAVGQTFEVEFVRQK